MANQIFGTSVYLLPGMSVKISAPVGDARNNMGWYAAKEIPSGAFKDTQNVGSITRGFVVEDTNIGNIQLTTEEEAAVVYKHKKAAKNSIWFFSATGERGVVNIVSVPIHDHSSIVQGGPAYGTYFSDDQDLTGGS